MLYSEQRSRGDRPCLVHCQTVTVPWIHSVDYINNYNNRYTPYIIRDMLPYLCRNRIKRVYGVSGGLSTNQRAGCCPRNGRFGFSATSQSGNPVWYGKYHTEV